MLRNAATALGSEATARRDPVPKSYWCELRPCGCIPVRFLKSTVVERGFRPDCRVSCLVGVKTQMQICLVCRSNLPLSQFYANKRERAGFLKRCKACCIEASSQRRAAFKLRRDEMDHQALIEKFAALSGKSRRETELLLERRRMQAIL